MCTVYLQFVQKGDMINRIEKKVREKPRECIIGIIGKDGVTSSLYIRITLTIQINSGRLSNYIEYRLKGFSSLF